MKVLIALCFVIFAVEGARKPSECEEHRQRMIDHPLLGKIVPECEENGDYKGLQCHTDHSFCQCWDKKGHPVTAASRKIKVCDCPRRKDEAEKLAEGRVGALIPQCQPDGNYEKKQCWASTGLCWCVDEAGKEISKPTMGEVTCE